MNDARRLLKTKSGYFQSHPTTVGFSRSYCTRYCRWLLAW